MLKWKASEPASIFINENLIFTEGLFAGVEVCRSEISHKLVHLETSSLYAFLYIDFHAKKGC